MFIGGFKKYWLAVLFFLLSPVSAHAASLYFSPASGSYALNSNLAVNVYVSSADKAMNAVSGVVDFPSDKLQVTSISKTGSVINLWVSEPSFSNSAGTVNFEGVALNPGYTGSNGKVITINFKVKGAGAATLSFSGSSVLANDGQGTEILSGTKSATLTLGEGKPVPLPVEPPAPAGKPEAPRISSDTHPDQTEWYNIKDAKFVWDLPAGVTKARVLVDSQPSSEPAVVYAPAIKEKEIKNVDDGIWYFHVQLNNAKGWGAIAHYRFRIDTASPESFSVNEIKRIDLTDPKAAFIFEASDSASGIDYYDVRIDNNEPIVWRDDGTHRYETSSLKPGNHILTVRAFDHADNYALQSIGFEVAALKLPIVESYPAKSRVNEPFSVVGKTYPNSQVTFYLQRGSGEPVGVVIASDATGKFVYTLEDALRSGSYSFWLQVATENGARSGNTDKFSFLISEPLILYIGSLAVNVLAVMIPLIALVIMLIVVLWYGWYRFKIMRKQLGAKVREVGLIRQAFELLRNDILKDIRSLERIKLSRKLTDEEERIADRLEQDMIAVDMIIHPKTQKSNKNNAGMAKPVVSPRLTKSLPKKR